MQPHMLIKTTPYQHQCEAFSFCLQQPHTALFMEQGTGKTLVAIAYIGHLFAKKKIKSALIICPTTILSVWEQELEKHANYPYKATILDGGAKKASKLLTQLQPFTDEWINIIIVNYELVRSINGYLAGLDIDFILCDESHRIKNPKAKISKFMHRFGKGAKHRMILTGTPVSQSPLDLWSQYQFLDPNIFKLSWWNFMRRYARMGGYKNKQIIGCKRLPELTQTAHKISYRVRKQDALELPPEVDLYRYSELSSTLMRQYKELQDEWKLTSQDYKVTIRNKLGQLLKLTQFTNGFIRDSQGNYQQIHDIKLRMLMEVIEATEGKIVVFCRFLRELDTIAQALEKAGYHYVRIQGSVKKSLRVVVKDQFQTDPNIKVMLAQIKTAGEGITLHAASTMVFYSLNYSHIDHQQCRSRIHRIGQEQKCTYVYLLIRGTIDERIKDILDRKGNVATLSVDDWETLLS